MVVSLVLLILCVRWLSLGVAQILSRVLRFCMAVPDPILYVYAVHVCLLVDPHAQIGEEDPHEDESDPKGPLGGGRLAW